MFFSALCLLVSAALVAAQNAQEICATPGACLRVTHFNAIKHIDPKPTDHTAFELGIMSDNPKFGASAHCEADWLSGTQGWPKQRKDCSPPAFSFYVNDFEDIDGDFVIEATYAYRDPSVAGPQEPNRAPQDVVTNFARGNLAIQDVICETVGESYKFCHLKDGVQILLPIYSKTA